MFNCDNIFRNRQTKAREGVKLPTPTPYCNPNHHFHQADNLTDGRMFS